MSAGPGAATELDQAPAALSPADASARRRAGAAVGLPLSVAVLAVPALMAVVRLLVAAHRPFDFYGDEAILDSAVHHVGRQLVGPYSRFGFHQPGPAYYYLLAPFSRLPGASAAALFLGAFCVNLGASLSCVLVVRRFLGESVARWSAVVVGALLVCLTPGLLANPWNPYVLTLPVLLTVLLAAAAAAGSPSAAAAAAIVGSYVVQTHLATTPTLVAMFVAAGAVGGSLHLVRRRTSAPAEAPPLPRRRRITGLAAAGAVLVLMWTPPLVEQATRSPGNLTTLARFFRAPHPEFDRGIDHGLGYTTGQLAAQLTVLPFGHDRKARAADPAKLIVAAIGVLLAAAVAVTGWRRRRTVVAGLGAMSVVGPLAAVWSGTRIVGDVFPYLLVWTSSLLLPGVIGAGALWLPPPASGHSGGRWTGRFVALSAIGVGISLTWTMAKHPVVPYPTSADVGAAVRLARPWLADNQAHEVRIRIAQHDRWPLASGVAVRLETVGVKTTVDQEWTFVFGDHFRPTGHEDAAVWVADAGGTPPGADRLIRLGVVGEASVWAGRVSSD